MAAPTARDIIEAAISRRINYNPFIFANVVVYGADPTGVLDSTAQVQAASDDSLFVWFPPGTYRIDGQILSTARAVTYVGAARGAVTLKLNNSTDSFVWSGSSSGGGIGNVILNVTGMTGGYAVKTTSSNRWMAKEINVIGNNTAAGGFYVADFNSLTLHDIWMNGTYAVGGAAITAFGSTSVASNVLDINNVEYGGSGGTSANSSYGLVLDSGVNTINIRHFAAVSCYSGLITTNTAGTSLFATFIDGEDVEVDGAYGDGIVIGSAGTGTCSTHNFNKIYVHRTGFNNATGSGVGNGTGIYIFSNSRSMRFQGGDIITAALGGVFCDGNDVHVSDMKITKNSQVAVGTFPAFQLGPNSYECNIHHNKLGQHTGAASSDQSYGVQLDAGSKRNIVVHNECLLNTLGPILDNALDPNTIIKDNLYVGNTQFNCALSPVAMAATVNNYQPTNWSTNITHLRLTPAGGGTTFNGLYTGTGATTFIHGTTLFVSNLSAVDTITFAHLAGASNAWNQFSLPGAASLALGPLANQTFMYDGFLSKWIPA